MKKKPIIGISSSLIIDQSGMFPGYKRAYVNKDYVDAVLENGGIPFIIPFSHSKYCIRAQVMAIDGLILSGGQDIFPLNYGEEPSQKLGDIFPERDQYEYSLLGEAMKIGIPILGICRGAQIINTYLGGTLNQDLSYMEHSSSILKHWQAHSPELRTHSVVIEKQSKLNKIFTNETILVNSFHHQTINKLGNEIKATAFAKDGVIEAIEHVSYPFMVGIQWHPEMLIHTCKNMNNLFLAMIKCSEISVEIPDGKV